MGAWKGPLCELREIAVDWALSALGSIVKADRAVNNRYPRQGQFVAGIRASFTKLSEPEFVF